MTSAIMNTAQSGLQAAQAGLLVTSQNVAGASVEGYSRRDASVVINRLAPNSVGVYGTSFSVEGFTRDYSRLLENQRLSQQGKSSYYSTLVEATQLLDVVVADESSFCAVVCCCEYCFCWSRVKRLISFCKSANLLFNTSMSFTMAVLLLLLWLIVD